MKILYKIMRNHRRQGVPTLYIQVKDFKYYFNMPETSQRFLREHGVRIGKDSRFFFTGVSVNHLMGMIGLCLTMFQQQTSHGSMIYGPAGITSFFRGLRYMMGIKLCHFSIACLEPEAQEKQVVAVKDDAYLLQLTERKDAVELFSNWDTWCESGQLDESMANRAEAYLTESRILDETRQAGLKSKVYNDQHVEIVFIRLGARASAYAVIPKPIKRKFNVQKLGKYGLNNSNMKDLTKNGQVTVEYEGQQKVITLEDVIDPPHLSPAILVIDSSESIDGNELFNNQTLQFLFQDENQNKLLNKEYYLSEVIHFGDFHTISQPNYQTWVISASTKDAVSGQECQACILTRRFRWPFKRRP